MNTISILLITLMSLGLSSFAKAQDKGFRIDPMYNNTCTNREAIGPYWKFGNNPGVWGECGLIEGGKAPQNLQKADLRGLIAKNVNFDNSDFSNANLSKAELENVIGTQTNFSGVNFSEAKIKNSLFGESKFVGAKFDYAKFEDISAVAGDFRSAVGEGFNWHVGNLIASDWSDAKITNSSITWVTAARSKMVRANFRKTKLNSNFSRVDFAGADLSLSDLSGTNLEAAKLKEANLKDAYLFRASATASELPFSRERAIELGIALAE